MTLGEAKERVSQYIDWSGKNALTLIENFIYDTRLDIALKYDFPFLFTVATTQTIPTNTYEFPEDFLDHLMIFIDDGNGNPIVVYEMTPGFWANHFAIPNPTSIQSDIPPYRAIIQGTSFRIFPDPPEGRTLTLWYYRKPDKLSSDDSTDYFLTMYGEVVVWGAAWRGAVYLDDEQKASKFLTMYQEGIRAMIARENRKKADRKGFVRMKSWKDFDPATLRRMFHVF